MAISMSDATIDDSTRKELLGSEIDGSFTGVSSGTFTDAILSSDSLGGSAVGGGLAGITQSFATNVSNAIDTYVSTIMDDINKLENANSEVAFKGAQIKSALTNFIDGVREVAISYTNKLKAAEQQIINSVATAYQQQDADVSSNLGSDTATLESNKV